jgi:hypothetical protein
MRATKSVVVDRARRVLGLGSYTSAHRAFGMWRVELMGPDGKVVKQEDAPSLPEAYGRLAAWLGGKQAA